MAKTKPNEKYRLLTVQIAVQAEASIDEVCDEISRLLGKDGEENLKSCIAEWQFTNPTRIVAVTAESIRPGEIFKKLEEIKSA